MRPPLRIGAIYRKELLNILRDRRTLAAMVVIPVVLYPLLMLGFLRAMETEQDWLQRQRFFIEVDDEQTADFLDGLVKAVRQSEDWQGQDRARFEILVGQTPADQLGDTVQLHANIEVKPRPEPFPPQLQVQIDYSEINTRSRTAMEQLVDVLNRYGREMTRLSLRRLLERESGRPATEAASDVDLVLRPVDIEMHSAATEEQRGGWALGQIVPIILVLMTITGAVYPAIDLTAGERERGTLETLLATPVPVLHVVIAKFLVVATIGLLAATINVLSVAATMYFGGVAEAIAAQGPTRFPGGALPIILVCMVPFALLSAAILVAACSFARSFKEAQNYVMPIIIVSLIPAVAATLPSIQLRGAMLVLPVGNMVLLARELLQQTFTWGQVAVVLLSTTLYAAAAVAVAARLFGQEAVLFADAGSYKTLLQRRLFHARRTPTASQALMMAALLFPCAFYVNTSLGRLFADDFVRSMTWLAGVQFLGLFVLLPLGVTGWLKIDVVRTFRLHLPPARSWVAAILLGVSTWVVAHEFVIFQMRYIAPSPTLEEFSRLIEEQLSGRSLLTILLLMAIIPAISEEFLFRGFVLSGLGGRLGKWPAILAAAGVFGMFHFMIDRMPVTILLGAVLGYVCWQSRSVWPAMLVHCMHNGTSISLPRIDPQQLEKWTGISAESGSPGSHLPAQVLIPAAVCLLTGLVLLASLRRSDEAR
jgi:ABC-2 type transport system permease protein/sodium transport system permease protein